MGNIKDTMAHDTINIPEKESSSAAATPQNTYSAQELAEMFLSSRDEFFGIPLEEASLNWNPNFIYDFLYIIRDFELIGDAVDWIKMAWLENNHAYDSYDITRNSDLQMKREEFNGNLDYIKNTIIERIGQEERKKELREKLLKGYKRPTITGSSIHKSTKQKSTSTDAPKYPAAIQSPGDVQPTPLVKLEDLPENIRKKVLVSQEVFNVYVRQLNEDLWLTVEKKKTKLCGCLFFLSNFHHITSRDTKANEFAQLVGIAVVALKGKGSIESSIRRRNEVIESSIERSYKCYACADVNKAMEQEIYKLRNDCKLLIDGFQPVVDAMKEEEEEKAKAARNQVAQASQSA